MEKNKNPFPIRVYLEPNKNAEAFPKIQNSNTGSSTFDIEYHHLHEWLWMTIDSFFFFVIIIKSQQGLVLVHLCDNSYIFGVQWMPIVAVGTHDRLERSHFIANRYSDNARNNSICTWFKTLHFASLRMFMGRPLLPSMISKNYKRRFIHLHSLFFPPIKQAGVYFFAENFPLVLVLVDRSKWRQEVNKLR